MRPGISVYDENGEGMGFSEWFLYLFIFKYPWQWINAQINTKNLILLSTICDCVTMWEQITHRSLSGIRCTKLGYCNTILITSD